MSLFAATDDAASILGEGAYNILAGGHSGTDYYLFYFGPHQPLFREFNLPEGNYNIKITFGDAAGESVNTVKAETRRLILEGLRTANGKFETRTITVNIRNFQVPPPPLNARSRLRAKSTGRPARLMHWWW